MGIFKTLHTCASLRVSNSSVIENFCKTSMRYGTWYSSSITEIASVVGVYLLNGNVVAAASELILRSNYTAHYWVLTTSLT